MRLFGFAVCLALSFVTQACGVDPLGSASNVTEGKVTDDSAEELRFFENKIRPLLVQRCQECHAGENREGGLRLDSATAVAKGGDGGNAIVPGNPNESLLISAIRYEDLEMPPDQPLSKAEQALLESWIRRGAFWPSHGQAETLEDASETASWWAAMPVGNPVPPNVEQVDSPTPIDCFIDARLSSAGLSRAPQADRVRLIRRLSFDLLGLPPTPQQIDAFVSDRSPNAYERLVDRIFADLSYGERMGRLWLDLVRYAESDGWRQDAYRPEAWRYRQWVVDAFNQGMPYDQFVKLQIAGDEFAPNDPSASDALGFFRLGIYEFNQRDAEGQWQNIVDEITDTTADVFLATGIACAKCHDHKFDPIPRGDYYRMRSVFEPIAFIDQKPSPKNTTQRDREKIRELKTQLAEIENEAIESLSDFTVDRFPLSIQAMYRKSPTERNSYEQQMAYMVGRQILDEGLSGDKVAKKIGKENSAKRNEILKQLSVLNANPYTKSLQLTVRDVQVHVRETRLPGRTKGKTFEPAAPTVFVSHQLNPTPPLESPQSTGRRSALANWIVSPENPITARVMVNRLWQYHFGTGLVDTPNDFGNLGSKPSHPELLDYLASEFIRSGWDIQRMQRLMVRSAAYQQSAVHPQHANAHTIDANNRLFWHRTTRRLDAEQFRDSLLIAMDSMIPLYGGASISGTAGRRSLYLQRKRNSVDEMLALLDCPPGVVGTAKRDVTVTAPQSLMMMNNPRMLGVAKKFASRVRGELVDDETNDPDVQFVRKAHRIITGHWPPDEIVGTLAGHDDVDVCHVLLNSNAFLFVD